MTTLYFGAPIARNEDCRPLAGRGAVCERCQTARDAARRYLRSPRAHARLGAVDLSRVRVWPDVVVAYAADDLGDYYEPGLPLIAPPPIV